MTLKDIKMRMQAINKTATITQAMHNIALSKIKRSTDLLHHAYTFTKSIDEVVLFADQNMDGQSKYTLPTDGSSKLYILVTSDRGLCGSYHNQLFKTFLAMIEKDKPSSYQVFVIGKKGYYFVKKKGINMINNHIIFNRDDITTVSFRHYANVIKDAFKDGLTDEVILCYNHYENSTNQVVRSEVILPVTVQEDFKKSPYIYDTDPEIVLDRTINIYVESKIFEAVADAKLSEHGARMVAMKSATDNANEIVEDLHMLYHRARQQEITSELIDVINGSNA